MILYSRFLYSANDDFHMKFLIFLLIGWRKVITYTYQNDAFSEESSNPLSEFLNSNNCCWKFKGFVLKQSLSISHCFSPNPIGYFHLSDPHDFCFPRGMILVNLLSWTFGWTLYFSKLSYTSKDSSINE